MAEASITNSGQNILEGIAYHSPPPKRAGVCALCGSAHKTYHPKKRYCSRLCQQRALSARGIARVCVCEWCKKDFRPTRTDRTRFCSKKCAAARPPSLLLLAQLRKLADANRTKWQASSVWCSQCEVCQTDFVSRKKRSCCSTSCAKVHYGLKQKIRSDGKREDLASRVPMTTCDGCGKDHKRSRRCCSSKCTRRVHKRIEKSKRRARQKMLPAENVDPITVFIRDGWRCMMCGIPTPRRLRGTYDVAAPELDHIVPLASGGHHTYANTQCLCRSCNAAKGVSAPSGGDIKHFQVFVSGPASEVSCSKS